MTKVVLLSHDQILEKVKQIAQNQAQRHLQQHPAEPLMMISILEGAKVFAQDLRDCLCNHGLADIQLEGVSISSYGEGLSSTRQPVIKEDLVVLENKVAGKHLLIVEDIIETGYTLKFFLDVLAKMKPASVTIAVLIAKKGVQEVVVNVDEIGFEIENDWIDGYGIDTAGEGRDNPHIMKVITA